MEGVVKMELLNIHSTTLLEDFTRVLADLTPESIAIFNRSEVVDLDSRSITSPQFSSYGNPDVREFRVAFKFPNDPGLYYFSIVQIARIDPSGTYDVDQFLINTRADESNVEALAILALRGLLPVSLANFGQPARRAAV